MERMWIVTTEQKPPTAELDWLPPFIPPADMDGRLSLIGLQRDLARHARSLDRLHADIRALDLELRTVNAARARDPYRIVASPDGPRVVRVSDG